MLSKQAQNDSRRGKRLFVVTLLCALGVLLGALAHQSAPVAVRASAVLTPVMYLPLVSSALFVIPEPDAQYHITLLRQLTPCENNGNHNLYVLVVDMQGNGVPNTTVESSWPTGAVNQLTGQRVENIPVLGVTPQTTAGFVDFPIYHGPARARVISGLSEQTPWLREDLPDQACETNDNPNANSTFHYSYLVYFLKRW